jgi:transposase
VHDRCVQTHAAQVLIAECGLDMALFPTVGHFASSAGACPGHHESAGRRRSGRTRPGPRWLTDALTECARAAVRTSGQLGYSQASLGDGTPSDYHGPSRP